MDYWMVACSVFLYIAILGVTIRICRGQFDLLVVVRDGYPWAGTVRWLPGLPCRV
jgi:hypothetical protein